MVIKIKFSSTPFDILHRHALQNHLLVILSSAEETTRLVPRYHFLSPALPFSLPSTNIILMYRGLCGGENTHHKLSFNRVPKHITKTCLKGHYPDNAHA